jgi:dCMP deaminase
MEWIEYFRNIAEQVKLKSKDESTKIGAVIVNFDNSIVSTGYNSFPRGIDDSVAARQERPEKYFWFEHAERNAIYNAARMGSPTLGTAMILSCGVPCTDCARGIINAGIKTVWCVDNSFTQEKWKEHAQRSLVMFEEAGVVVKYYA